MHHGCGLLPSHAFLFSPRNVLSGLSTFSTANREPTLLREFAANIEPPLAVANCLKRSTVLTNMLKATWRSDELKGRVCVALVRIRSSCVERDFSLAECWPQLELGAKVNHLALIQALSPDSTLPAAAREQILQSERLRNLSADAFHTLVSAREFEVVCKLVLVPRTLLLLCKVLNARLCPSLQVQLPGVNPSAVVRGRSVLHTLTLIFKMNIKNGRWREHTASIECLRAVIAAAPQMLEMKDAKGATPLVRDDLLECVFASLIECCVICCSDMHCAPHRIQ